MSFEFVGSSELELFKDAREWKCYFSHTLGRYITGEVLEVGAGRGDNLEYLYSKHVTRWTCLEPDFKMAGAIKGRSGLPDSLEVSVGTLASLDPQKKFDTILYIDVLEHIEDDRSELKTAATFLKPGGRLIVLSPAHPFLFSPFDKAVGHHRRYTKSTLGAIGPEGLELKRLFYLDSVGFFASLANRLVLQQRQPTPKQIRFWNKVLIPCSRIVDGPTGYNFGKTVIGVWMKTTAKNA